MPCPYFLPLQPLIDTGWEIPPRSPLGRLFSGECRAGQSTELASTLKDAPEANGVAHPMCNFGYARGQCPRFPVEAPYDAVRFHRRSATEVLYVYEKENVPFTHGIVQVTRGQVQGAGDQPLLAEQVRAFCRD